MPDTVIVQTDPADWVEVISTTSDNFLIQNLSDTAVVRIAVAASQPAITTTVYHKLEPNLGMKRDGTDGKVWAYAPGGIIDLAVSAAV